MKKILTQKINLIAVLFAALIFAMFTTSAFAGVSGGWTNKYQKIKGQWSIIEDTDGAKLVLSKDFATRNAPDLKFILTNAEIADMKGSNAMNGALVIAPLKSNSGEQVYILPKNFKDFKTLALHCEQYSKLWGATDITAAK